jgi:outer membrane protein OmpU
MNTLKKIGLTALAGSLVVTSANAVDYAVTGDAVIKMTTRNNPAGVEAQNGKGIGVDTDLYFNASGELDNGYTVAFFQAANTDAAWANSSSQVTVGMGSLGTLQINNIAGAKANGIDDVMPFAYEETWDSTDGADHRADFFGASTASGSVDYRIPAQEMMGLTINASLTYDPNSDAGATTAGGPGATTASGTAYTLQLAHESGLEIGGGHESVTGSNVSTAGLSGQDQETSTGYVKFASGPISVGYQESYQDAMNGAEDKEGEAWGVAYTSGDISVSYGESEHTNHGLSGSTQITTSMDSIQVAYTMGAMTISAATFETSNAAGTTGRVYEENELAVSFAF